MIDQAMIRLLDVMILGRQITWDRPQPCRVQILSCGSFTLFQVLALRFSFRRSVFFRCLRARFS
jgi:hypothetical protein